MLLILGLIIPMIGSMGKNIVDNWYYLPSYPNYAPSGLPDFDARAQFDWKSGFEWSHCAPTSFADILWWFDSKHENQDGTPGDGVDDYPLVPDFKAPSSPNPGPNSDDHNFNNVNDLETPWKEDKSGELIEVLAFYCNTNFFKSPIIRILLPSLFGTSGIWMYFGLNKYIRDAGLEEDYQVKIIYFPSFSTIEDHVRNNDGVSLVVLWYNEYKKTYSGGHAVGVAGINPDGYIAFSDPGFNEMNPQPSPSDYNDASIVSHDIWEVDLNPPVYPGLFSFWLPDYGIMDGALVVGAVIISDIS
jgi:hypothetical protein